MRLRTMSVGHLLYRPKCESMAVNDGKFRSPRVLEMPRTVGAVSVHCTVRKFLFGYKTIYSATQRWASVNSTVERSSLTPIPQCNLVRTAPAASIYSMINKSNSFFYIKNSSLLHYGPDQKGATNLAKLTK